MQNSKFKNRGSRNSGLVITICGVARMTREQLEDFAGRYAAAWCSHDGGRWRRSAPAGWLKVNDSAAAVGREMIAAVAQGFFKEFPDLQVLDDGPELLGDWRARFHWTLVGT